jgi:hypothetical protein
LYSDTGVIVTDPPVPVRTDIRSRTVLAVSAIFTVSAILTVSAVFTILAYSDLMSEYGVLGLIVDDYPFSSLQINLRSQAAIAVLTVFSIGAVLAVGS